MLYLPLERYIALQMDNLFRLSWLAVPTGLSLTFQRSGYKWEYVWETDSKLDSYM